MPYLIYPPNRSIYVLDDEDSKFLMYFDAWAWPFEKRPANDDQVLQIIDRMKSPKDPSLYTLWKTEYTKRLRTENRQRQTTSHTKHIGTPMSTSIEVKGKSSGTGLCGLFKFKSRRRSTTAEKSTLWPTNHLEDIQRSWKQ